jgi:NAD-dependent deacetylase
MLPRCNHCAGPIRPGVVWFNEMLPRQAWADAEAAASTCDVFLTIGTSGLVYPAAGLSRLAADHQAQVVIVNPDAHAQQRHGDIALTGAAGLVLPGVVGRMG